MKEKICVVLTGGTICSVADINGKNQSNAKKTSTRLTEYYLKESGSPFRKKVKFDIKPINLDVLSENMTASVWSDILKIFKNQINYDEYKGIIVLHGTDTLAYTSAFLSLALAGIKIPVCMVSAQLKLGEEDKNGKWIACSKTNGYANFRASVELIMNGIEPNVYVVYRNEKNERNGEHEEGEFLVHYGAHLLQCANSSNNFHSRDEMEILDTFNAKLKGKSFESADCLYRQVKNVKGEVLLIKPYTNLDYSAINLKGVKLIVHGTYHAESVCIGRPMKKYSKKSERDDYKLEEITKQDRPYSILYLLKKCKERDIPVFLAPCDEKNAKYQTTANACKRGAVPVGSSSVTIEAIYAKAVLGCALGKTQEELKKFLLDKNVNDEF